MLLSVYHEWARVFIAFSSLFVAWMMRSVLSVFARQPLWRPSLDSRIYVLNDSGFLYLLLNATTQLKQNLLLRLVFFKHFHSYSASSANDYFACVWWIQIRKFCEGTLKCAKKVKWRLLIWHMRISQLMTNSVQTELVIWNSLLGFPWTVLYTYFIKLKPPKLIFELLLMVQHFRKSAERCWKQYAITYLKASIRKGSSTVDDVILKYSMTHELATSCVMKEAELGSKGNL